MIENEKLKTTKFKIQLDHHQNNIQKLLKVHPKYEVPLVVVVEMAKPLVLDVQQRVPEISYGFGLTTSLNRNALLCIEEGYDHISSQLLKIDSNYRIVDARIEGEQNEFWNRIFSFSEFWKKNFFLKNATFYDLPLAVEVVRFRF